MGAQIHDNAEERRRRVTARPPGRARMLCHVLHLMGVSSAHAAEASAITVSASARS